MQSANWDSDEKGSKRRSKSSKSIGSANADRHNSGRACTDGVSVVPHIERNIISYPPTHSFPRRLYPPCWLRRRNARDFRVSQRSKRSATFNTHINPKRLTQRADFSKLLFIIYSCCVWNLYSVVWLILPLCPLANLSFVMVSPEEVQ